MSDSFHLHCEEHSPAKLETRNPKPEIRNKSKLMEMGNQKVGKPQHFVAACEQFWLLQCKRKTSSSGLNAYY
jgi:hypothetical protein